MSAPAQKVPPSPVSTSARTPGSAASAPSSGGSAAHIAAVIALRFAGWRITTVATESVTLCSSCGSSMRRMLSAPVTAVYGGPRARCYERPGRGTRGSGSVGTGNETGRQP